jgi:hypothetical protein
LPRINNSHLEDSYYLSWINNSCPQRINIRHLEDDYYLSSDKKIFQDIILVKYFQLATTQMVIDRNKSFARSDTSRENHEYEYNDGIDFCLNCGFMLDLLKKTYKNHTYPSAAYSFDRSRNQYRFGKCCSEKCSSSFYYKYIYHDYE